MKCPYCERRLRLGFKCRACRRYILPWPYVVVFAVIMLATVLGVMEFYL
jgi:hypothetical protein